MQCNTVFEDTSVRHGNFAFLTLPKHPELFPYKYSVLHGSFSASPSKLKDVKIRKLIPCKSLKFLTIGRIPVKLAKTHQPNNPQKTVIGPCVHTLR